MTEEIRLTRDIHNFVRGHLSWEESLRLFDEIVESEKWMSHLEIDMMIYQMAVEKQESKNHNLQFLY
jgi:hypothetical protein